MDYMRFLSLVEDFSRERDLSLYEQAFTVLSRYLSGDKTALNESYPQGCSKEAKILVSKLAGSILEIVPLEDDSVDKAEKALSTILKNVYPWKRKKLAMEVMLIRKQIKEKIVWKRKL